tara:strand:- start:1117 stop:1692 length:576 start_codon:yes stop_codon:yes gene_type:complete
MNQEEINLVMTLIEQISVNDKEDPHTKIWQSIKGLESIIENIDIQSKLQEGSNKNDTVLSACIERVTDLENELEFLSKRIVDLEDKTTIVHSNQVNETEDLKEASLDETTSGVTSWHYAKLNDVLYLCNSRVFKLLYKTLKISTLGELMGYTATELLSYKNFGKISLDSLNRDLADFSSIYNLEISLDNDY